MANEKRGEIEVTVGKTQYLMRPTFNAMMEIDSMRLPGTPGGWNSVFQRAAAFEMSIIEAAQIVRIGIIAGDTAREKAPSVETIAKQIAKEGTLESTLLARATTFLVSVRKQTMEELADEKSAAATSEGKQ